MSDKVAAIRGTFADFRLIKGRKVCQLVVELPIEEADAALVTLGGLPQPAAEKWVAKSAARCVRDSGIGTRFINGGGLLVMPASSASIA